MFRLSIGRRFAGQAGLNNKVVIIGGGAGGITTAGHLIRKNVVAPGQVTIIDGSLTHYYKPGWSLYGTNQVAQNMVEMKMAKQIPTGVHHIDTYVESL